MKTITYMIDADLGNVMSRVGDEVAVPVLDFEGMTPDNGYAMTYNLEKFSVFDLGHYNIIHTRKIPISMKNKHRKFWGMKLLS